MVQYTVRRGKNGDTKKFRYLWEYCFPQDDKTFLDWFFTKYHKPEYGYIAEENGNLVGAVTAAPYKLSIRGAEFKAVFIEGVSVAPEYRKTGTTEQIFNQMFQELKQEKVGVALLTPFSSNYYRRLGFANIVTLIHNDMEIETIRYLQEAQMGYRAVHSSTPTELVQDAYIVYTKSCNFHDFYIKRSLTNMKHKLADLQNEGGHIMVIYNQVNEPCGYILYSLEEKYINVKELLCADVKSGRHLLSLIYGHGANIKRCRITIPDSNIGHILLPCDSEQERELIAMAKIIDIETAFNGIHCPQDGEVYIVLGHKNYRFVVKDGKGKLKEVATKVPAKAKTAVFTEHALATLYMGVFSAKMLYQAGKLIADNETIELLDKMFPALQRYFNEEI